MNYISLHNHTTASLLDGMVKAEMLVEKAYEMGFDAIGITDHGSISGAIKFYNKCRELNIQPIIGIEAYYVEDSDNPKKGEDKYHIVLFAKTEKGLKSLFKLMTKAHEKFYYTSRIDYEMLIEAEDVIISTACLSGLLSAKNEDSDRSFLIEGLMDVFEDDFYLEIMPIS